MKNLKRGFILQFFVAIITLLVAGGAAYIYLNPELLSPNKIPVENKIVEAPVENIIDTPVSTSTPVLNISTTTKNVPVVIPIIIKPVIPQVVIPKIEPKIEVVPKVVIPQTPATIIETPTNLNSTYDMGVLVLKYFPTKIVNGVEVIDISVTGDVGDEYNYMRQHTVDITNGLKTALENATKYLGYKNSSATSALKYNIVDTFEYKKAVPTINYQGRLRYPDYNGIMTEHNICDYVDNKGVKEVWLFAYQGPAKADGQPSLDINESKMSSSLGDVSNSQRYNEMPICKNAYVVYTYNYQRGVLEAMEDHMHQFEAQFRDLDIDLYNKFIGPYGQEGKDQSCGWAHYAPNSPNDYDWANKRYVTTDCFDWNPQGTGVKESVNCDKWSCNGVSWFTMWMQTVPGKNNGFTYNDKKLGNFWYFIANWNTAKSSGEFF